MKGQEMIMFVPHVGQMVGVKWTNNNNQWKAQGKVTKVNDKTIRVALASDLDYPKGGCWEGKIAYFAGQEILVPKVGTPGNGVFALD